MNTLLSLFDTQTINNVVVTLFHSLWQGLLIAVGLWVYLSKAGKSTARARYAASFFAMVLLMAAVVLTYSSIGVYREHTVVMGNSNTMQVNENIPVRVSRSASSANPQTGRVEFNSTATPASPASKAETSSSPWLVKLRNNWENVVIAVYALGVFIMTMRVFVLLGGTYKLKNSVEQDREAWRTVVFDELAKKMQLAGKVAMAVSDKVIIPCTIGFVKPVILLPASILIGVDETQLRAILAHELTHIKRHDWLFNIIQMFIEAALFFNPAVWWISRHVRLEREAICDEGVVAETRKPIEYAELLFQFAGLKQRPAMAAALGFSGDNSSCSRGGSPITERIKRLIVPGHRPAGIRPGIIPAIVVLCLVGAAFFSLHRGTEGTLKYIGRYLSPQQRTEVMSRVNEEYSGETGLYDEDQVITVRGRLVRADGDTHHVKTHDSSQSKTVAPIQAVLEVRPYENDYNWPGLNPDGTFEFETCLKRFYIIVRPRDSYAVSFFGPFEYAPGETVENLQLTLETGFTARIKLVNQEGNPIADARITGGYPGPPEYGSWHHTIKSAAGEDGVALIENSTSKLVNLSCEVPGYVKEARQKIMLSPDEPYIWQLMSSPATKIKVISAEDGRAVDHASVVLDGKEYSQINRYNIDSPDFKTDSDGQVKLLSLSRTETYLALVHAKGYQRQYTHISGGDDIVVTLKTFTPVRGKITGDLSRLLQNENGSFFEFANVVRVAEYSSHTDWCGDNKVYVELVDGDAHFEIDDYYGHQINIKLGSRTHKIDIDKDDMSSVVIDIPLPSSYETKKVVFAFVDAATSEPIEFAGEFALQYKDNPDDNYTKSHTIDVDDGKAEVDILLPNHIRWEPTPKTGWFFYNKGKDVAAGYTGSETIHCYPAGAIFGKITNPSEQSSHVFVNIHTTKKSPSLKKNYHQNPIVDFDQNVDLNPGGVYCIAPLPLGGAYAISASSENLYWLSNDIKLTEKNSICEYDIILPENLADIQGQLVDADGTPLARVHYSLNIDAKHGGSSYSNYSWSTDHNGCFELKGCNPEASIKYKISFGVPGFVKKMYELDTTGANRLILERSLAVKGTVLDEETNKPLPGVTVEFMAWQSEHGLQSFKTTTNANGQFTADQFADAEYWFTLRKEGYPTVYDRNKNRLVPSKDSEVKLYIQKQQN